MCGVGSAVHCAYMFRRFSISALWFVSFVCLHEVAWSVAGSPRILGLVAGGLAAGFCYFDPFHCLAGNSSLQPEVLEERRELARDRARSRTGVV